MKIVLTLISVLSSCIFGLTSDINKDGYVNLVDFSMLADHYGQVDCGSCRGRDLTGDGVVDSNDVLFFANEWLLNSFPEQLFVRNTPNSSPEVEGLYELVAYDFLGHPVWKTIIGSYSCFISWDGPSECWQITRIGIPMVVWRGCWNFYDGPCGEYVGVLSSNGYVVVEELNNGDEE